MNRKSECLSSQSSGGKFELLHAKGNLSDTVVQRAEAFRLCISQATFHASPVLGSRTVLRAIDAKDVGGQGS